MPQLEYFVVCRAVQEDVFTDELSLVNVLEDVSPTEFPDLLQRAIGVSVWRIEPPEDKDDFQAAFVVKVPGKNPAQFRMNLRKGPRRLRAISAVEDIPLEGPGVLEFEVFLNGQHAASHLTTIHGAGTRESPAEGESLSSEVPTRAPDVSR